MIEVQAIIPMMIPAMVKFLLLDFTLSPDPAMSSLTHLNIIQETIAYGKTDL